MKTKQTANAHAKAIEIMKRETNRAVSQVEFLEKLYREMIESKKKEAK